MIDYKKIQQAVTDKLVNVQKHPTEDLFIYNYNPRVQYEKLWDETTKIWVSIPNYTR
jgi:hypothetical protein